MHRQYVWTLSIWTLAAACGGTSSPQGEPLATQNDAGRGGNANATTPAAACTPYTVPATTNLASPTVSFRRDVYPAFTSAGCRDGGCHGSVDENQGLFLGDDPANAYANMVGVPAPELPMMSFVTPKSPSTSYIMHKLDHDECTLERQCAGGCGSDMPLGRPQLALDVRDTIRRWIAQGAPNN